MNAEGWWGGGTAGDPKLSGPGGHTLEHTPKASGAPLMSASLGCSVVAVTRTHDVLKKARTNLEVRK